MSQDAKSADQFYAQAILNKKKRLERIFDREALIRDVAKIAMESMRIASDGGVTSLASFTLTARGQSLSICGSTPQSTATPQKVYRCIGSVNFFPAPDKFHCLIQRAMLIFMGRPKFCAHMAQALCKALASDEATKIHGHQVSLPPGIIARAEKEHLMAETNSVKAKAHNNPPRI